MQTGMIFTVERMINECTYDNKDLQYGWIAVTQEKSIPK